MSSNQITSCCLRKQVALLRRCFSSLAASDGQYSLAAKLAPHKEQLAGRSARGDLLSRMTLERKWPNCCPLDRRPPACTDHNRPDRGFLAERAAASDEVRNGPDWPARERKDPRQGAIFSKCRAKWLLENTRLGPGNLHEKYCMVTWPRGAQASSTDALASTWDPEFVSRIFSALLLEPGRAGVNQVLGPNLMSHLTRWGQRKKHTGETLTSSREWQWAVSQACRDRDQRRRDHHPSRLPSISRHTVNRRWHQLAACQYLSESREFFLPGLKQRYRSRRHERNGFPHKQSLRGVPSHANNGCWTKCCERSGGSRVSVVSDSYGISAIAGPAYVAGEKADAAHGDRGGGTSSFRSRLLPAAGPAVRNERLPKPRSNSRWPYLKLKFLLWPIRDPYVDPERAVQVTNLRSIENSAEAARRSITLLRMKQICCRLIVTP